jgi:uncharacterized protein YaiE (UPF0345 family)
MKHSVYFDGKVQSLEIQTQRGRATVDVIEAGKYNFSTTSEEHIIIIEGSMKVKLPRADWKEFRTGDKEIIDPRNELFDIDATVDVAYLCYYL